MQGNQTADSPFVPFLWSVFLPCSPHGSQPVDMGLCLALMKPNFSSACLLSIGLPELYIEHCTKEIKCLCKRTLGGHCIARNMNWLRRSLWLKTEEQKNFQKLLICSCSDIYPFLSVFWGFAQGRCCRQMVGLDGALDSPVPTVIPSFENGRVQVYTGLCNGFVWAPQAMAICSRVGMLS